MENGLLVTADLATAREIDQKVRHIAQSIRRDFLGLGGACRIMDEERLWTVLKDEEGNYFQSFDSWLASAVPQSRALAYAAKRIVKELSAIPRYQLERMSQRNMELLRQLPEPKRTPEIIEAAQNRDYKEFSALVQEQAPEEHLEAKRRLIFNLDLSQARKIEELLEWLANDMDTNYGGVLEEALEELKQERELQ